MLNDSNLCGYRFTTTPVGQEQLHINRKKTMEAKEVAPAQSYAEILTLTYGPTALVIRLQLLATVNSVRAHGDM